MKILFVCHGNICRSPMAEIVMRDLLRRAGREEISVASAATSAEELGNPVYPPAGAELARHGLSADGKRAVQNLGVGVLCGEIGTVEQIDQGQRRTDKVQRGVDADQHEAQRPLAADALGLMGGVQLGRQATKRVLRRCGCLESTLFDRQGKGEHEAAERPDQAKVKGKRDAGKMLADAFDGKGARAAMIDIQTRGDEQNAERDNEQAQHNTVRQMDALDGCL